MKTIWIELAARDLARANRFYATVFGHEPVEVMASPERAIAIIPGEPIVSLTQADGFVPNGDGTLPYFDVDGSLEHALEVLVSAGGSVVEEINERPGYGFFAIAVDTEGNHFYLHAATR